MFGIFWSVMMASIGSRSQHLQRLFAGLGRVHGILVHEGALQLLQVGHFVIDEQAASTSVFILEALSWKMGSRTVKVLPFWGTLVTWIFP